MPTNRDSPLPGDGGGANGWLGAAISLAGAALLVIGWYGVSGQATTAEQLPYIASASLPGLALVITGAVIFSAERNRRNTARTAARVGELHALLVESNAMTPAPDESVASATRNQLADDAASDAGDNAADDRAGELVAVIGTRHFHQRNCALVAGKRDVAPVDTDSIDRAGLTACPVCEPAQP